jgi:hypothetical protein
MTALRLAFLIYDSRSGSTLLSRELAAHVPELLVTREISFRPLLRTRESWVSTVSARRLAERVSVRGGLRNVGLDTNELAYLLDTLPLPRSKEAVIRSLLDWYRRREARADASTILVKSGEHVQYMQHLRSIFPDARFIHIYRDPRAVISSKLRTARPYFPRETMAWGGALLAASQWHRFSKAAAHAVGAGWALEVRYERLVEAPGAVVRSVADFLDLKFEPGRGHRYLVPEPERSIHGGVLNGTIDPERSKDRARELSSLDEVLIEAVLAQEMAVRGYSPRRGSLPMQRIAAYCYGAARLFTGAVRHGLYHLALRLTRSYPGHDQGRGW